MAEVMQEGWKQTFPAINVTTTNAQIPLFTPTLGSGSNGEAQLNFSAANYVVNEDGTAVTEIVITRTGNTTGSVSATLTFADGTAQGCGCGASSVNNDFNNAPITLTFAEYETRKVIAVENALLANPNAIRLRNDSNAEGTEYFTIQLTNPTAGASIGSQGSATVTILDDEAPSTPPEVPGNNPASSQGAIDTSSTAQNASAKSLINLDDFWTDTRFADIKGQGFSSVVIDTGIDLNHSFFGPDADGNGVADRIVYQYDFADNDTDASDKNGHGSHVASIIGSSDSTYGGIAPDANLIALKVFKDTGAGYFSDLEESLQWVINNAATYNIASVNLSLGDERNWQTDASRYGIGDELAALAAKGIIVTAAAGNNFATFGSTQGLAYPAADPNTISVGAVWSTTDQIADFSQRDQNLLEVFAPGIPIVGANATGGTQTLGGTSQAAPHIAGIAVLAQQIAQEKLGRKLTVNEFRTLLDTTGIIINDGDDEVDSVTNTGLNFPRVTMLALAEAILTLSDNPDDSPAGDTDDNSTDDPLYLPGSASPQSHTVTLTSGQVLTDINFGSQRLPEKPVLAVNTGLTLNEDGSTTITASQLQVTDVDSAAAQLTFTLSALPENGILLLNGIALGEADTFTQADIDNNRLTYTHDGSETVSDSFSFTVTDEADNTVDSTTFQIAINPVNDAPTLENPIADQQATEAVSFSFTVPQGTFQDVDIDDILSYAAILEDGSNLPDWLTFDANTQTFSGTPNNDNVGNFNIKVIVTDLEGETAEDSFELTITGAPVNEILGGQGNEAIQGTAGNDRIFGLNGRDTINAGEGDDIVIGGPGVDLLSGGPGNDRFVYTSLVDAGDTITDFTPGEDKIVLTALLDSLGYSGSNPIADGYVGFQSQGSNSFVLIDADGAAGPGRARPFIQVQNVGLASISNGNNFEF